MPHAGRQYFKGGTTGMSSLNNSSCNPNQECSVAPQPGRRRFLKVATASALGVGMGLTSSGTELAGSDSPQAADPPSASRTRSVEIDFSNVVGVIKPLNGVNGGPLATRGSINLSSSFSEIGIQHVRLHDVPWMWDDNAVDINYVFPHFEADENDPQSYEFLSTDYYLKSIFAIGSKVTYRLGYSMAPRYQPLNAPPRDFAKWAAVCSHVVRHYNQGWANGYHYSKNIKYWEIWNEPDGGFWAGTPEQYYHLYEVTAKALKNVDSSIRVGGPALAGKLEFLDGLLKHCAERRVPLDFVSWHTYERHPYNVCQQAAKIQDLLDRHGYSKIESILDEWNYFPGEWGRIEGDPEYRRHLCRDQMAGVSGAAFDASVLIYLQDSTVALADFYQGTSLFWGGLFDEFGVPQKTFFTFKAFKFLLGTPHRVRTSGSDQNGFATIAGLSDDNSEATILISNFGTHYDHFDLSLRGLPWKTSFTYQKQMVDSYHDFDLIRPQKLAAGTTTLSGDLEAPSVCVIRLRSDT